MGNGHKFDKVHIEHLKNEKEKRRKQKDEDQKDDGNDNDNRNGSGHKALCTESAQIMFLQLKDWTCEWRLSRKENIPWSGFCAKQSSCVKSL